MTFDLCFACSFYESPVHFTRTAAQSCKRPGRPQGAKKIYVFFLSTPKKNNYEAEGRTMSSS